MIIYTVSKNKFSNYVFSCIWKIFFIEIVINYPQTDCVICVYERVDSFAMGLYFGQNRSSNINFLNICRQDQLV